MVAALYLEAGIRGVERGIVSKGRDPISGEEYRPDLELVRLAISRRVYTRSHMDYVVEGIKRLYEEREKITGLEWVYEPPALRFFKADSNQPGNGISECVCELPGKLQAAPADFMNLPSRSANDAAGITPLPYAIRGCSFDGVKPQFR